MNNEIIISRKMNSVMDLGYKFSYIFDPKLHLDFVCYKAFKALGFSGVFGRGGVFHVWTPFDFKKKVLIY